MSEPFLERLSRFTPDAGGLDRDELIYAAGRRSARTNRGWMTVASLLAATQALSLVLLLPPARPLPAGVAVVHDAAPVVATAVESAPRALEELRVWSARVNLAELEPENRPAGDLNLIESGPALRAFTRARLSILD
jgi:hypothetical protein